MSARALDWREVRRQADYQRFTLGDDGRITEIGERMGAKLDALAPFMPESIAGWSVLDLGCDLGFWSFLAAGAGAERVLGVDRNRTIRGLGEVDLQQVNRDTASAFPLYSQCRFGAVEVGRDWADCGRHDLVLCLSMYHHAYELAGAHAPVWYWLWRQMAPAGVLIWEGPLATDDPVVRMNVSEHLHGDYREDLILAAARRYFVLEGRGPALHEPTREVLRLRPRAATEKTWHGRVASGAGGASAAFAYAGGRRQRELAQVLGVVPVPGSLNLSGAEPFEWDRDWLPVTLLDVVERSRGLDSLWAPRPARVYPTRLGGLAVWAFRFDGERYPGTFVELVSGVSLKATLGMENGDVVAVVRDQPDDVEIG